MPRSSKAWGGGWRENDVDGCRGEEEVALPGPERLAAYSWATISPQQIIIFSLVCSSIRAAGSAIAAGELRLP